nr:transposase [Sinorhizobium meliloti]
MAVPDPDQSVAALDEPPVYFAAVGAKTDTDEPLMSIALSDAVVSDLAKGELMGRVEILTGVERRRLWTDEDKLRILGEVQTSGSGVAEIARRHDILPQQIYTWRKKLGRDIRSPGDQP